MSTHQKNQNEEEVDLGSLFVIIGKGFRNFFNFIGNIFKGIFHFVILILIFIKTNIKSLLIAGVLGGVLGGFLEFKKGDLYGSQMLLKPNFESTRQLYNNVNFYNDLVKQKDTASLQKTFNLSKEYAASLKKFEIEAIVKENDIIEAYDDLILAVDTTTVKSYSYEEFKNSFTPYDYKIHKITVEASTSDVFNNLDEIIISSVTKNKYFNRVRELTNENLNLTDSVMRQNLFQIDTLRKVYMQSILEEAKKQTSGTSIDLGGEKSIAKEIALFDAGRRLNEELKEITEDRSEKFEIINIISNFQPIGYEIKAINKNYVFLIAFLFMGIVVLILLLKQLNSFLNKYGK